MSPSHPYVTGVGGFAADNYWSSSEGNAFIAWVQYFFNGHQGLNDKGTTAYVRPVRGFQCGIDLSTDGGDAPSVISL